MRRRQEELERKEVVESIKAREVEELSRIANLSWEELETGIAGASRKNSGLKQGEDQRSRRAG